MISNPTEVNNESTIINELFMAGLKCFHLRKPASSFETITKLLNQLKPEFYERIAIHQFHEMANDFGIKRLHYTEMARGASTMAQCEQKGKNGLILSTSVHDYPTLTELKNFDYAFYGPVFNSISKTGYKSVLPDDFILNKVPFNTKVIALGGIELSNLNHIKPMGFDGAAVLGTIWKNPERALSNFKQLQKNLPIQQD